MNIQLLNELLMHTAHAAEEATTTSPDVATMFGLNVKLFVAQLINFGIVLFVLWKWVFTPVTKALQRRTQKIEESLQTAEKIVHEKAEFEEWKKGEIAKARTEAAGIVSQSKLEAEAVRAELLTKAKLEQEKIVQDGKAELAREEMQVLQDAKSKLADLVVGATEKILREKITDKKDRELAEAAVQALSTKY